MVGGSKLEIPFGLEQNLFAMGKRCGASLRICAAIALIAVAGAAHAAAPPPDLVKLERLVSLELAHVRDVGPTEPVKRQQLFEARQLDQKGEDAIKAGDYKSAQDCLLRAQVILRQLGD
jgi:hypothetical protein